MYHTYNQDGSRNTDFQPRIFADQTTHATSLYDPSRPVEYGLYTKGVPNSAISVQQDLLRYQQKLNHPITNAPINSQYLKPVYHSVTTSDGKTGKYKNLYML